MLRDKLTSSTCHLLKSGRCLRQFKYPCTATGQTIIMDECPMKNKVPPFIHLSSMLDCCRYSQDHSLPHQGPWDTSSPNLGATEAAWSRVMSEKGKGRDQNISFPSTGGTSDSFAMLHNQILAKALLWPKLPSIPNHVIM